MEIDETFYLSWKRVGARKRCRYDGIEKCLGECKKMETCMYWHWGEPCRRWIRLKPVWKTGQELSRMWPGTYVSVADQAEAEASQGKKGAGCVQERQGAGGAGEPSGK